MSWMNVLNTGANLYQAGQVSSLASTQGAMLNFQIDQKIRDELRKSEVIETRRMVVRLTGILEDAIDYMQSYASYSAVVIPICGEFANSLGIDESNFDEVSDMELARNLKRTVRRAKTDLKEIWSTEIENQALAIGNSLANGSNDSEFQESWIPDEGDLISEIYTLISARQKALEARFSVEIENKSRTLLRFEFTIKDNSGEYVVTYKVHALGKISMFYNEERLPEQNIKQKRKGFSTFEHQGEFTLPNGKEYQLSLVIGNGKLKSAVFKDDRGMEFVAA